MQRKIIQIADSTQLVSLPRKWALKYNLKKGEEVEVTEAGSTLQIRAGKSVELKKIEIDVTDLDRTSLIYCVQSVYRMGYDEVDLKFSKLSTTDVRYNKTVSFLTIIQYIVNRLAGFEIIHQSTNKCVIKNIQEIREKDFDLVLKRIFNIWRDSYNNFLEGMKNNKSELIEVIEDLHDNITKFVSFCLRALNKMGDSNDSKTRVRYHIISNLDKTMDVIKHAARDVLKHKIKLDKEGIKLLEDINTSIIDYSKLYYKFDLSLIKDMSERRSDVKIRIKKLYKKSPVENIILIDNLRFILEILLDLVESRWGLEY